MQIFILKYQKSSKLILKKKSTNKQNRKEILQKNVKPKVVYFIRFLKIDKSLASLIKKNIYN